MKHTGWISWMQGARRWTVAVALGLGATAFAVGCGSAGSAVPAGADQGGQPSATTLTGNTAAPPSASGAMDNGSAMDGMPMDGNAPAGLNQAPVPMKVVRHGNQVTIDMTTEETTVEVASGVKYHAWTFDGTVPGPVIQLQQGDDVTLRLHNIDPNMAHSIDLHAVLAAPDKTFVQVGPKETRSLHFTAEKPGVYMYHCATEPMLLHIGNGMYGAVVVTPKGQPAPDYTIVQSEVYENGNYEEMLNGQPQYVVFNGRSNQYLDTPLHAKVGKPLTIAFVNAGPNHFSAFHIVGTVLGTVEPSGSPKTNLYDLQTYTVAPGDGALFQVTFNQAGTYTFVTHDMADAQKGAMGHIVVE